MIYFCTTCYVVSLLFITQLLMSGNSGYVVNDQVNYTIGSADSFFNWTTRTGNIIFPDNSDSQLDFCGCNGSSTGYCFCEHYLLCLYTNFSSCINAVWQNVSLNKNINNNNTFINEYDKVSYIFENVTSLVLDTNSIQDALNNNYVKFYKNVTVFTFFITENASDSWNKSFYFLTHAEKLKSLNIMNYADPEITFNMVQYNNGSNLENHLKKLNYINFAGQCRGIELDWIKHTPIKYLNLRNVQLSQDIDTVLFFNSLPKSVTQIDFTDTFSDINGFLLKLRGNPITTLGLSSLKLETVPSGLFYVSQTLKYLTLNGNIFQLDGEVRSCRKKSKTCISNTFEMPFLPELLELDLRNCGLIKLHEDVLNKMPKLQKLSLSGNKIAFFEPSFTCAKNLMYLDISFNHQPNDIIPEMHDIDQINFKKYVNNPVYVDVSYSNINLLIQGNPLPNTTTHLILSHTNQFCYMYMKSLFQLQVLFMDNTKYVTRVFKSIIDNMKNLNTLKELHFINNKLNDTTGSDLIENLQNLRILNLKGNDLEMINKEQFKSLKYLEVLDLSYNNIAIWQSEVFTENNKLKEVNISSNKLSMITDEMVNDFVRLKTLDISNNPLLCNNKLKKLICLSDNKTNDFNVVVSGKNFCFDETSGGALSYYEFVSKRGCGVDKPTNNTDDNNIHDPVPPASNRESENHYYYPIYIILSIFVLILILVIIIVVSGKWYMISYYFMLIKLTKGAILFKKPVKKNLDGFRYDVFVSYSENDRFWVFDELLPQLETSGTNICLHERDFQVGMTIMENIMDNMHRSHCLLLVISNSFIKSRWCQFEMSLAQFFLVEMRDRQILLVFLEHIPKSNRPKLLHYLMTTKTYLEWPQEEKSKFSEEKIRFFKRLSLALQHKNDEEL